MFNQKVSKFIQRIYKLFIKNPTQLIKFIDNHKSLYDDFKFEKKS